MYREGRLKNRICFILMGLIITVGILSAVIEAQSVPSSIQMINGTQAIEQTSLDVVDFLNSEELAANEGRSSVVVGIMRTMQNRSNLSVHLIHILLVYLPTFLTFFYLLVASFLLCLAQGRSVIISYIHNKDGQKDKLHN